MDSSVSTPLVHAPVVPLHSPQRLMSPSRLAKLPPITSNQDESQYLHTAKSELKDSMHHLLDEVHGCMYISIIILYTMSIACMCSTWWVHDHEVDSQLIWVMLSNSCNSLAVYDD